MEILFIIHISCFIISLFIFMAYSFDCGYANIKFDLLPEKIYYILEKIELFLIFIIPEIMLLWYIFIYDLIEIIKRK